MKKAIKIASVLVSIAIMLFIAAGCGDENTNNTSEEAQSSSEKSSEEDGSNAINEEAQSEAGENPTEFQPIPMPADDNTDKKDGEPKPTDKAGNPVQAPSATVKIEEKPDVLKGISLMSKSKNNTSGSTASIVLMGKPGASYEASLSGNGKTLQLGKISANEAGVIALQPKIDSSLGKGLISLNVKGAEGDSALVYLAVY